MNECHDTADSKSWMEQSRVSKEAYHIWITLWSRNAAPTAAIAVITTKYIRSINWSVRRCQWTTGSSSKKRWLQGTQNGAILWSNMKRKNYPKSLIIDATNEGHRINSSAIAWKHCGQTYSTVHRESKLQSQRNKRCAIRRWYNTVSFVHQFVVVIFRNSPRN